MTEQEMFQIESEIQASNRFGVYNHVEVVDVKKDYAEASLTVVPDSCNFRGTVHGGAYFTIADVVSGMVCRTDGRVYATQQANVQFFRPVSAGKLTGRGTVIHRGRSSCLVEVRVTTEEEKLAFMGTFLFACIGPGSTQKQ